MELKCAIQSYDWGKKGTDSIVAILNKAVNHDFVIKQDKPYAELWMGTHPNGPSYLKDKCISLQEYIESNTEVLGVEVNKLFGSCLPFLLKVLSVNKALSIQAHPDKEKSAELHLLYPNIYKDSNHKPELAIALTKFQALCGFRPCKEIKEYLKLLPELEALIGTDTVQEFINADESNTAAALKKCFLNLMTCDPKLIVLQLKQLLEKLSNLDESSQQTLNFNLLKRLHCDYPGDVGCFGIYIFNVIELQPGEALFLGPNEPHAYLFGDCIECMACSDNVVRAGLTPKFKDVKTLTDMLTYKCEPAFAKKFKSIREDDCTEVFRPPVQDFAVAKIWVSSEKSTYTLIPRNTASILITIRGKAKISEFKNIHSGSVLFIPASEKIILCECEDLLIFQAFTNV